VIRQRKKIIDCLHDAVFMYDMYLLIIMLMQFLDELNVCLISLFVKTIL